MLLTSLAAVDPWRAVILTPAVFQASKVLPIFCPGAAVNTVAYGIYSRENVMDFARSGLLVSPTESMSNCRDINPGINPPKSIFLITSFRPSDLAKAVTSCTSYPAGLPLESRYISGLNCKVIPTIKFPAFTR